MRLPTPRPRVLRALAVLASTVALSAAPFLAGTASAEPGIHSYVDCPEPRRGLGCGFEALVPEGSWIFLFRYRDNNGVIQNEVDSGTCTQAECPALTFAVPRIDRVPLGYDVYAGGRIVVGKTFVRFGR